MKNLSILISYVFLLSIVSCSKNRGFFHYEEPGLSDDFFKITATLNGNTSTTEDQGALTIPFKENAKLNISEATRTVKDVSWYINGGKKATGNNASISVNDIGVYDLNITFKESSSGKSHNRTIKLYVYKEINISATITPTKAICGEVAIGITSTSSNGEKFGPMYLLNSIQNICTSNDKKTASIARVPVKVYDNKTSFTIDLIEPNKTSTKASLGFCLLFFCFGSSQYKTVVNPLQVYQTDQFPSSLTQNLNPGQYASGNTQLILE